MVGLTAVIRVKAGAAPALRRALEDVVRAVRSDEPGTIAYYVVQDGSDPHLFTTYERYSDQAALDRHNTSDAVARFFEIARPLLAGEVVVVSGTEVATKA